jgi:isocitrate dehydrogenase
VCQLAFNSLFTVVFQYKATDYVAKEPGKLELVFTPKGGKEQRMEVFTFKDRGGVGLAMYNTDEVSVDCQQLVQV